MSALKFAANLSWLYPELPFLDRFAAAARDGFNGVECLLLHEHPLAEIQARLNQNGKGQQLHATTAAKHFDPGVDALFAAIAKLGGLDTARGGEKACWMASPDA